MSFGVRRLAPLCMEDWCGFRVHRNDGIHFAFDGNKVKKLGTLAKMIEQEVGKRGKPWHVELAG